MTGLLKRLLNAFHWQRQRNALRQIDLLVLDVDGVLTDGGLWFDPNGLLQKRFDVRDGLGLRLLQQAGLQLAFLSGGKGGATEVRAQQLGINHCLIGIKDKSAALQKLQKQLAVSLRILLRTKLREQDVLVSRQLQVPFRRRKSRSRRASEDSLVRVSVRQQVPLVALLLRHPVPLLDWVKKQ